MIAVSDRERSNAFYGPAERDGALGAGRSVHLRDPDGGLLELLSYGGEP